MSRVNFIVLATFLALALGVVAVIAVARGYRFNLDSRSFSATGILVATSDPDGAEVLISSETPRDLLDGKIRTATNNTLNLSPGKYDIKIQKDGYNTWEKKVEIKKEEVFKTNVFLFPRVPDLRPLTLTGAINPTVSPDGTKVVYSVASASGEKNGVWVIDLGRSFLPAPIPSPADFRIIYRAVPALPLSEAKFLWSSDQRQVLAYSGDLGSYLASPGAETPLKINFGYLLKTDATNVDLLPETEATLRTLLNGWQENKKLQDLTLATRLDIRIESFLASKAAGIKFSPDESKVMYEATGSGTLASILSTYLPGRNPTQETREVSPGNLYVYDIKEDKNYLIARLSDQKQNISWFPSSKHLLEFTDKEISVMEFDGTNRAVVYAGPFYDKVVVPWPNWSKIMILTSLNNISGVGQNLYTINLR